MLLGRTASSRQANSQQAPVSPCSTKGVESDCSAMLLGLTADKKQANSQPRLLSVPVPPGERPEGGGRGGGGAGKWGEGGVESDCSVKALFCMLATKISVLTVCKDFTYLTWTEFVFLVGTFSRFCMMRTTMTWSLPCEYF